MAKSLSAIKTQIEKLQKQADSIQSNVIARIKREIAQHGLTADDLFGSSTRSAGKGAAAQPKKAAKAKAGAAKPAKFADEKGNTWHGVGKRPDWIHEMLAAGRKLEEFLIGKKAKAAKPAKAVKAVKKPAARKAAAAKKTVKAAVKPATKPKAARKKAPAKRSKSPAPAAASAEAPAPRG